MAKVRHLALMLPLLLAGVAPARDGLGFDAVLIGAFPVQGYKQTVSPGGGVLAGFELPIFSPLSLTARSGAVAHLTRKDSWRLQVPAFAGAKLISQSTSLYLSGEAGPVLTRDNYTGDDSARSSHSTRPIAWGLGIGSAIDEHDLRISLHFWDSDHPRETMTFGISLAILYLGD